MLVYRNVAFVMVAMILFQLAAGGLWVALPLTMSDAEWGELAIGAVYASYGAGFLLGALSAPWVIRRIGHIRAFAAYAGGATAATLGLALGFDFTLWSVLRLAFGACAAGLFAVSESWIADATPKERRGAVVSVYQIAGRGGLIAGPFLFALPVLADGATFALAGIALALCLIPVVFTTRSQPLLPHGERAAPGRLLTIAPAAAGAAFTAGFVNSGLFAFLPIWAGGLGPASAQAAAIIVGAAYAGALISQWPAGHLSDRLDRRIVIAALAGVAGSAALLLAVPLDLGLAGGAVLIGFWGAASLAYYGIAVAHAADRSRIEELPAIASGLLMVWAAGSLIGPLLFGLVSSCPLGDRGMFLLAALFSFGLAAAMFWRRRSRSPVPAQEREPYVNLQATSAELADIDTESAAWGDDTR
jgi:MFS family permease